MLYYITENSDKVTSANLILHKYNITATQKDFSFIEIQSDSVEKIALNKTKQAFLTTKDPFVVSDTGWEIPALGGFPGAYMHHINTWFTPQDFLNLIKPYADRSVVMKQIVCYKNQKLTKTFSYELKGIILKKPKGKGRPNETIFSFKNDAKSIAECRNENIYSADDKHNIWQEFAEWYVRNK